MSIDNGKRKKNNKASKAIQKNLVVFLYTSVLRLRSKELSPLDNHLMKHALRQFDREYPWELISNCKINSPGPGFHVLLLWGD